METPDKRKDTPRKKPLMGFWNIAFGIGTETLFSLALTFFLCGLGALIYALIKK